MRVPGIAALLLAVLLQGCSGDVMTGIRIGFAIFMFVVIVGSMLYAVAGNRKKQRSPNDPRTPDADDNKK
jgi:hypothetical protein